MKWFDRTIGYQCPMACNLMIIGFHVLLVNARSVLASLFSSRGFYQLHLWAEGGPTVTKTPIRALRLMNSRLQLCGTLLQVQRMLRQIYRRSIEECIQEFITAYAMVSTSKLKPLKTHHLLQKFIP